MLFFFKTVLVSSRSPGQGDRVWSSLAFLVPKPSNKRRPIQDLSTVNHFLKVKSFKMETPETVRLSLQTEKWVTSLDFNSAYFHIQKFISVPRPNLSVHTPTFWTINASDGIHLCCQRDQTNCTSLGYKDPPVNDWLTRVHTKEPLHYDTQSLMALYQELG